MTCDDHNIPYTFSVYNLHFMMYLARRLGGTGKVRRRIFLVNLGCTYNITLFINTNIFFKPNSMLMVNFGR